MEPSSTSTSPQLTPLQMSSQSYDKPPLGVLPAELMALVCDELREEDFANLRLVDKRCAEFGAIYHFRRLRVMFTYASLQKMLEVAKHPVFCKHVKELAYSPSRLIEVENDQYFKAVRIMDKNSRRGGDDVFARHLEGEGYEAELRKLSNDGWRTYSTIVKEQDYLNSVRYDVAAMSRSLPFFTNLSSVCLENFWHRSAWAYTFGLTHYLERCGIEGQDLVYYKEGLEVIMLTLDPYTELNKLDINPLPWSAFSPPPTGLNFNLPIFSRLQVLSLSIESDMEEGQDELAHRDLIVGQHRELGVLLRSASGLVELCLYLGLEYYSPSSGTQHRKRSVPISFGRLFGDFTWPELRFLSIESLTAEESQLANFLRRHAPKLKTLHMRSMWLNGEVGAWIKIWELMKNEMTLKRIRMAYTWGIDTDLGWCIKQKTYDMNYRFLSKSGHRCEWQKRLFEAILKKEEISIQDMIPAGAVKEHGP